MSNLKTLLCVFLTIASFTFIAKSQNPNAVDVNPNVREQQDRQKLYDAQQAMERSLPNRQNQVRDLEQKAASDRLGNLHRRRDSLPATAADKAAMKKIIEPNPEDLSRYAGFLLGSNTGIFRLFPNFDCVSKGVIRVDGECANFVPDAWSYSFRQRQYSNFDFSDIRLGKDNLVSDGLLTQNILVDLGNVKLENISLTDPAIKYLDDFKPETEVAKIKDQYLQIKDGIKIDNLNYTKIVKVNENTTYAARLIAYRCRINNARKFYEKYPADAAKYMELDSDKREDLIIAFRVIRKESDGSITILWKRLKRQDSAKIVLD